MSPPKIRSGSRKKVVYVAYEQLGRDSAMKVAIALGLKPNTLHAWISTWRRPQATRKRTKQTTS